MICAADAIEIVVGQGAKPGGGGMLLGQKITERVAGCAICRRESISGRRQPPSGLDRPGRSGDQNPGAARDHRLGKADLRKSRRIAAVLRHCSGSQGRGRCRRARRHARRHGGDAGSVYRDMSACPSLAAIAPAVEALQELDMHRKVQLIVSGGIRNGADMAKGLGAWCRCGIHRHRCA